MSRVFVEDNDTKNSYYFDVTFKETHTHMNEITQNPVQDGANINDHVYQQPILFTWDVGMSDCLSSIVPNQFNGAAQRSVAAFDVLESLWKNSPLLTITTSFKQYRNMLIKSFVVTRDKHTRFGMKATVVFQQVIVTAATDIPVTAKQSSDPQTTEKNNTGAKSASPAKSDTVKIPEQDYTSNIKVKYNGSTLSLEDYMIKYANQDMDVDSGKQKLLLKPLLSASVAGGSTFVVNGKQLNYDQFVKKYAS